MDQIKYTVTHSGVHCKALKQEANTVQCEDIVVKDLDNVVAGLSNETLYCLNKYLAEELDKLHKQIIIYRAKQQAVLKEIDNREK